MNQDRALTRRFALLQAGFFGAYAGTSFFSYILLKQDVPNAYIGLLGALTSCSCTLIQPVWGIVCDRFRCHRLFYFLTAAAMPLLYLCITRTASLPVLALCAALSGMLVNCMQNMGNGWISSLNAEGHAIDYGTSRSCGSFAFAIMAVVLGWAVNRWGYAGLIGGMALCGAVCVLVSLTLPRSTGRGVRTEAAGEEAPTLKEGLAILLRQRPYLVMLGCAFLAMMGLAGVSSYFSAYLGTLGADAFVVGLGNFAYAIAEVPFMFLSQRLLRRFPFEKLFAVCLFAHGAQCLLVGVSPNYVCAILAMLLQGLSFGTLVPCLQDYTARHIDDRYASTAQLFTSAVALSASMIFGGLFSSALSRTLSLPATFMAASLCSFCGCAVYVLYTALAGKRRAGV